MPNTLTQKLKLILRRRQAFADKAAEITQSLPDAVIIVMDPKTDIVYASFDGLEVSSQVHHENGAPMNLVRGILNHAAWKMRAMTPDVKGPLDKKIDQLLIHMGDVLCSLAEARYNKSKGKVEQQTETEIKNQ